MRDDMMEQQRNLFDAEELPAHCQPALARNTDPVESHMAAESVNVTRGQRIVLAYLRLGAATDEQLYSRIWAAGITITDSGVRGRRAELVAAGLVERCGTGKTAAGRNCGIWRAVGAFFVCEGG